MRKLAPLPFVLAGSFGVAFAITIVQSKPVQLNTETPVGYIVSATAIPAEFSFLNKDGKSSSAAILDDSSKRRLDPDCIPVSPQLEKAATIAQERANAHSKSRCWQYVKQALLAAGAVDSYPDTEFAKEAGNELVSHYGFVKLETRDPYAAPVGAVLVYYAENSPGHVEIRTKDGFVSDFRTKTPSPRPLLGIFVKA